MFEQVLFAAAAAATIAGFLLEVWRETKSIVQEDDEGEKQKRPALTDLFRIDNTRAARLGSQPPGFAGATIIAAWEADC